MYKTAQLVRLEINAINVHGEVTKLLTGKVNTIRGRPATAYYVAYKYKDLNGIEHTGQVEYTYTEWKKLKTGATIPVVYDRKSPGFSRGGSTTNEWLSVLFCWFALVAYFVYSRRYGRAPLKAPGNPTRP